MASIIIQQERKKDWPVQLQFNIRVRQCTASPLHLLWHHSPASNCLSSPCTPSLTCVAKGDYDVICSDYFFLIPNANEQYIDQVMVSWETSTRSQSPRSSEMKMFVLKKTPMFCDNKAWISWNLSFCYTLFHEKDSKRFCDTTTPESIHTKDESKRGSAFAFIFGVNWPFLLLM